MKDNKFTKRMSDKRRGELTWRYFTMAAITFVIIFAVKSSGNDTRQYKCVID